MTKPIAPKTTEAATVLCERYAVLEGKLATIAGRRDRLRAKASAAADTVSVPIVDEMAAIAAQLEPWWKKNGSELTGGKRKSMTIGGCSIGTKLSTDTLAFTKGDDKAALAALQAVSWKKPFIRVTYSVDKAATLKAMAGTKAKQLQELGFKVQPGEDMFFVKRAAQGGTIA